MSLYTIIINEDALKDIFELYNYIAENDLIGKAQLFKNSLNEQIQKLSFMPHRGHRLREMEKSNIVGLYEIFFHSYRIIYSIANHVVTIHGVIDSRRDLEKLLIKRFNPTIFEIV